MLWSWARQLFAYTVQERNISTQEVDAFRKSKIKTKFAFGNNRFSFLSVGLKKDALDIFGRILCWIVFFFVSTDTD